MKREYTIISDSREKKPLVFPETLVTLDDTKRPTSRTPHTRITLHTRIECLGKTHPQMKKGDYFLDGYADCCVVERKAHIKEIARNCLQVRRRKNFIEELDYLRERCKFPVLLLIGAPSHYMAQYRVRGGSHTITKPGGPAYAALIRLLLERNIWLLTMLGETLVQRHAMGECVAHLLISGAVTNVLSRVPNSA